MPELDAARLTNGGAFYVFATMLCPDDTRRRDLIETSLIADFLADEIPPDMPVTGMLVTAMHRTPKIIDAIGGPKLAWRTARKAAVVGWALGFMIRAAEHGHAELVSRTRALTAASRAMQSVSRRGRRGDSLQTLERDWDRFGCVAHLWGTERLRYWEMDAEIFSLWLSAAEQMRRRGEALRPWRRREPILDPRRMWRVPASFALPDVPLRIDPPRSGELAFFTR